MKASELRIGNLIINRNKEIDTIVSICSTADGGCDACLEIMGNGERELEPIPLTPEWLEKFGFKINRGWTGDSFFGFHTGFIELQWDENSLGLSIEEQYLTLDHIQYVHQLQNLFFALCGEELVIQ